MRLRERCVRKRNVKGEMEEKKSYRTVKDVSLFESASRAAEDIVVDMPTGLVELLMHFAALMPCRC